MSPERMPQLKHETTAVGVGVGGGTHYLKSRGNLLTQNSSQVRSCWS